MAELQESKNTGESAARFIEFVMMQAQNASLFLGLIPNPGTGQPEVNLELARMFIDQLAMIGEKTRGNLSSEEAQVLRNYLSNLQMAYYEVTQGRGPTADAARETEPRRVEEPAPPPSAKEDVPSPTPTVASDRAPEATESKKRFTKSYGG